jgi:hypothetical protein
MYEDEPGGKVVFPARLAPHMEHAIVAGLPTATIDRLTAWNLYNYLHFIVNLESKVVNRSNLLVAYDELKLGLPPDVRVDAWRIYCDEAHHALTSFDLMWQVEASSGIPVLPYDFDPVSRRLERAARQLEAEAPGLGLLLEVTVFETAITSLLEDIPRDENVVTTVREVVADHAKDERRHHAFYRLCFGHLWGLLEPRIRQRAALSLPEMILACLSTDMPAVGSALLAAGLSKDEVAGVLAETYTRDANLAQVRKSARHTIRMLKAYDVFELDGVRDAFRQTSLIV